MVLFTFAEHLRHNLHTGATNMAFPQPEGWIEDIDYEKIDGKVMTPEQRAEWISTAKGKTCICFAVQAFMVCVLFGCDAGSSEEERLKSYLYFCYRKDVAKRVTSFFTEHTGSSLFTQSINAKRYRNVIVFTKRRSKKFFGLIDYKAQNANKIVEMVLSMGKEGPRRFYNIDYKTLLTQAELLKRSALKPRSKIPPMRGGEEEVNDKKKDFKTNFKKFDNSCKTYLKALRTGGSKMREELELCCAFHALAQEYGYVMPAKRLSEKSHYEPNYKKMKCGEVCKERDESESEENRSRSSKSKPKQKKIDSSVESVKECVEVSSEESDEGDKILRLSRTNKSEQEKFDTSDKFAQKIQKKKTTETAKKSTYVQPLVTEYVTIAEKALNEKGFQ